MSLNCFKGALIDCGSYDYIQVRPDEVREWYLAADVERVMSHRDRLRAALVKLVSADGRDELEQLEAVIRMMPAPAEDRAASIDAIHALIATLP
jgi:hypothetical protein